MRLPLAVALPPRPLAAAVFEGPATSSSMAAGFAFLPAFPFFLAMHGPASSLVFAALLLVTVFAFSPFRGRFFCCFACAAVFIAFGPQKYLDKCICLSVAKQIVEPLSVFLKRV